MIKSVFKILFLILLFLFIYFIGILIYVWWTDFIPEHKKSVSIEGKSDFSVLDTDTLSFLSWNIGFGGLGEESDFFYDGGETVTMPKEIVQKNVRGIQQTLTSLQDKIDFYLLQEVDVGSKRSHWINQFETISESLPRYSSSFGKNYDVEYVPIPPTNPMGKVEGGIASWSKYKADEATRYSFEGNFEFPYHLFFLDRCFLLNRYQTVSGNELIVVNTHNSAYDDGSLKEKQLQQLQEVVVEEYEKGNYIIIGGDWNQYPAGYADQPTKKNSIPEDYPEIGWTCSFDPKVSTNRKLVEPYNAATTETALIDFYIVSPNIELIEVNTIDQQFKFSDHQAVVMTAVLK